MSEARSDHDGQRRPSPEALLELAEQENRGKLRVFLGMAPGVGKTYAMLSGGRAQKAEGVDVVVGLVETHGRSETAALLDGLDVLPRRPVPYRKRTLMEFDVEAAIARRPKLLLVDELAHTNAPGLLHAKRYQDVEDVLRAGIDVWTTLNIQHLESLTDVVQRITGVVVRETVPDTVLEKADEIVVIDLPPDELIQRLKDGKVYLPENARRAVDRFFRRSNLIALRELALRRAADRVDEQMLAQLRQQGIEGPWPTAERLLVCVGGDAQSEEVVRSAARLASALKSEWMALNIQPSDAGATDRSTGRRTEKAMRLAERLGATTARVSGKDLTAEILAFAKRNNITQIIIGRSRAGLLARWRGRSLSDDLMTRAGDLAITVVAGHAPSPVRRFFTLPSGPELSIGIGASLAAVTLATLFGMWLEQVTILPNLPMVFLLAVLTSAMRFGLVSAITSSVLSFLSYNYFFIDPRYTFTVAQPYELFSLVIFLVVAIVTGSLAGRLRDQAEANRTRIVATQALYDLSRKLSGAATMDDVVYVLANHLSSVVKGTAVVVLHDGRDLTLKGSWPPEDRLSTTDWAAARWCFDRRETAGFGTATLPVARYRFQVIPGPKGPLGVVGFEAADLAEGLPADLEAAIQSVVEQAAVALDRTRLVDEAARAETEAERERLRAALLSSISHDLRTPLASIVGSVTSLRQLGDRMSASDREELMKTTEEEAMRLSRFVTNLLDMTKLEAGALDIRRQPLDLAETARAATDRARRANPARTITFQAEADLPIVFGDPLLLEQVVFNLLDNADKYSPPGTPTDVRVARAGDAIAVSVSDQGIGIPQEALERVFEKFYRVAGSDGRAPGTGLGLTISSGIVTALGGTIRAESPAAGGLGTRMIVTLPLPT